MDLARLELSAENCPVAATLGVVGEKWTLLVIREAFYGVRRFEHFLAAIGCARNILGDRLRTLIEHDVLRREAYRDEGQRERYEYRLTERGLDLAPALLALMQWGNRSLGAKSGPPRPRLPSSLRRSRPRGDPLRKGSWRADRARHLSEAGAGGDPEEEDATSGGPLKT